MMPCNGRGHQNSIRSETSTAAKTEGIDSGPAGGTARPGQKLSCGHRAWEEKCVDCEFGNNRQRLRRIAFKIVISTLGSATRPLHEPSVANLESV